MKWRIRKEWKKRKELRDIEKERWIERVWKRKEKKGGVSGPYESEIRIVCKYTGRRQGVIRRLGMHRILWKEEIEMGRMTGYKKR